MAKNNKKGLKIFLGILIPVLTIIIVLTAVEFWYYPHYKSTEKQPLNISEKAATDEITVMSANVRCWSPTDFGKKSWCYRAGLVMNNVKSVLPDIIGFQEVTKFHYSYLQNTLVGYDSVIAYRDDTYLSESCPIFYSTSKFELVDKGSFWLSETPEAMSKDWGAACYRICSYVILEEKSTAKQFVVFNTHLDHISDEARIKGIGVVLDKISQFGGLPSMIMGDFNAFEGSETYKMATENFLDAKYQTDDTMKSCTYQNWGQSLDHECIDYFMISKTGFTVDNYKVITNTYDGVYPSDHFPISMTVRLTDDN